MTVCVMGLGVESETLEEVRWEIRMSSFCWVASSRACNSERACSRAVIHSLSILSNDNFSGGWFPTMTKEESSAGKYTEGDESELVELGPRNKPIVDFSVLGSVLKGDPFLMLGQLRKP